jgi:hypothetical protein
MIRNDPGVVVGTAKVPVENVPGSAIMRMKQKRQIRRIRKTVTIRMRRIIHH